MKMKAGSILKRVGGKAWAWFTASNRWKHFVGGAMIGLGADGWYCAMYTGAAVGGAMEMKDKMWGGRWDWTDWVCTVAGAAAGRLGISLTGPA